MLTIQIKYLLSSKKHNIPTTTVVVIVVIGNGFLQYVTSRLLNNHKNNVLTIEIFYVVKDEKKIIKVEL